MQPLRTGAPTFPRGARRTIVVGDVHGCLEELEALLAATRWTAGVDRLVLLGDLLDRGPDPVGVVRRARALGAECVLGNHEEKHLRYATHEARRRADPSYRNPVRMSPERAAENARLSEEDLSWLAALPRVIRLGGRWLAVHGGLLPGRRATSQPADWLTKLRYLDARGKPVHRTRGEAGEAGVRRWAEAWTGPESIVYGHHAREDVVVDTPRPGVRCVGIDTGCVYGGKLTALVLPAQELVQVSARAARAPASDVDD
jgi:bis(5'-nucleosyl)-tetraphosphatase (symmetrical)